MDFLKKILGAYFWFSVLIAYIAAAVIGGLNGVYFIISLLVGEPLSWSYLWQQLKLIVYLSIFVPFGVFSICGPLFGLAILYRRLVNDRKHQSD